MPDAIPEGITSDDVLRAIADFDAGVSHSFAESTVYDLLHQNRRYPPKAIIGLASRRLAGRTLTPYDFKGGEESRCFRVLRDLGFEIVPKSSVIAPPNALVREEFDKRFDLWEQLKGLGGPHGVPPSVLRQLGIYGGAQGIWVDKERTKVLTDGGDGVTVAVLHTGESYADDLSSDGVLYHYPKTRRPATRDQAEVDATKSAATLGLPIFVVTYPSPNSTRRDVALGWIEGWDDASAIFLITFGDRPQALLARPVEEEVPFILTDESPRIHRTSVARVGQQRFKFRVIQRYGPSCAVCGLSVLDLLDAAHICPKRDRGGDDPRNGIVLCASHHRAFDADMFTIEPGSLAVRYRTGGPTAEELKITVDDLRHLASPPHQQALAWRWEKRPQ